MRLFQYFIAALFFLGVGHALVAVEFAPRPTADSLSFSQDRQCQMVQDEMPTLSGFDAYAVLFRLASNRCDGHGFQPGRMDQQIALAYLFRQDNPPFAVLPRTHRHGGLSANRKVHDNQTVSKRARRQGPAVLETVEGSANIKTKQDYYG